MRNPLRGARYANVTATLALVVALGGTGYAVGTIGTNDLKPNAVTSAKIKNGHVKAPDIKGNAVRSAQVKDGSLTGSDVDESTLGQVPSAVSADSASTANDVPDVAMLNLGLLNGWTPWDARGAKYGKDAAGVVHLSGGVKQAGAFNPVVAVLPVGYRPTGGPAYISTNLFGGVGPARIVVSVNGTVTVQATAPATDANAQGFTSLDGVSFVP